MKYLKVMEDFYGRPNAKFGVGTLVVFNADKRIEPAFYTVTRHVYIGNYLNPASLGIVYDLKLGDQQYGPDYKFNKNDVKYSQFFPNGESLTSRVDEKDLRLPTDLELDVKKYNL